jgi:transcriptional regulator with XRE-family HTH domain
MEGYRYTESGLDDVFIINASLVVDDAGEKTIVIPNVNGLHLAIAKGIVQKPSGITGKELRFLRTEMGMTQAELASLVDREPLAISRWERGEVEAIDANAEVLIRLIAIETLKIDVKTTVRQVLSFAMPKAGTPPLEIDGSDPDDYRPLPRAA